MEKLNKGLSLMEVMVTLVIVAVIAGLAYPRYQKMVLRSKQTEAKTVLRSIQMGQDLFMTTNQTYASNLDDMDIQIPSTTNYTYSVSISGNGRAFIATAVANIDGDQALDEWQIDQDNNLVNTVNDVIEE
jgi:prepilin-type N-terminal cleavage/methylation domain-containing protein